MLTQHSLQVLKAGLVPPCVSGAQHPFSRCPLLVAEAGWGLWPPPASCQELLQTEGLWDTQGQGWGIKPSELCLSSLGRAGQYLPWEGELEAAAGWELHLFISISWAAAGLRVLRATAQALAHRDDRQKWKIDLHQVAGQRLRGEAA